MQVEHSFKQLPREQVSNELLWGITKRTNCFLVRNHGLTLSKDPLNLTGRNTFRDSGIANQHAIGISHQTNEKKVRDKRAKKKAGVVQFDLHLKTKRVLPKKRLVALKASDSKNVTVPVSNNLVYSTSQRLTTRSIVKALRSLTNYRRDLIPDAVRRLRRLHRFKLANKQINQQEAKKQKAAKTK